MIKSQLVTDLKQYTGAGVITRKQLMDYLGYKDRGSTYRYTYGLRKIGAGFSILEVAERIMEVSNA